MTATQNPAQDVSDARCSFLAGYVCAAMAHAHSSFTSDQILRLANKEADKRQWGETARELQQPVAYLLDSEDPRDRAASTCNTVAETWREAGFTVVELTRISQ
jgi:hypothetical protein